MQPKFFYFDLGKVLVDFSIDQMMSQVAAATGLDAQTVKSALFDSNIWWPYERGEVDDRQIYESFCKAVGRRPDYDAMTRAVSDIFSLHLPNVPIVAQLCQAGYRMGILSNTCSLHWRHCTERYSMLTDCFSVHALSFRIKAMKPQPEIYQAAAELAGVRPDELFFVDDLAENVAGAKAVGIDAVQYTGAANLAVELRRRGVRFNY